MLEIIDKSVIVLICVLISNGLAVEKPTSPQKTCVTEECHADYAKKAYVHGPVGLGDCKACHEPLKPEEHTYQFVRKDGDLCEYCHLEQTTKKNVHEPLKTGDCMQWWCSYLRTRKTLPRQQRILKGLSQNWPTRQNA